MKKSLLLMGLLASLNVNAAVNLIQNGGFESYPVGNALTAHVFTGGACTPGTLGEFCLAQDASYVWLPIAGAPVEFLEIRNNLEGVAQSGNNFAELTPEAASGITQTFSATLGVGSLSWWDKGRYSTNFNYSVFLNDFNIFTGNTASASDWTNRLFSVDLLETNTLRFVSNTANGGNLGAQIDNISVFQTSTTAVPEPETYGMMMLGLAMLGFASRRRKA